MTSNEFGKIKSQRAVGAASTRPAEENYTLESYLRNNLENLEEFIPKAKGVVLASRLGKDTKLDPDYRSENSLVQADRRSQSFEADLPSAKRPKKLFSSVLSYLAIAILSGGISGGGLLYFLLNYAVPHEAEVSSAAPDASGIGYEEASDRTPVQTPPSSKPLAQQTGAPPSPSAESQSGPTGDANSQPHPPASNGNAAEGSNSAAFFSAADANAKDASVGDKIAAIAPLVEAAPTPAPVPTPKVFPEERPAESSKPDAGAAKREKQLPRTRRRSGG